MSVFMQPLIATLLPKLSPAKSYAASVANRMLATPPTLIARRIHLSEH
jgi:hypothetical protein